MWMTSEHLGNLWAKTQSCKMNKGAETAVSMSLFFAMTYFPHLSSIFAFLVCFHSFKKISNLSQWRNPFCWCRDFLVFNCYQTFYSVCFVCNIYNFHVALLYFGDCLLKYNQLYVLLNDLSEHSLHNSHAGNSLKTTTVASGQHPVGLHKIYKLHWGLVKSRQWTCLKCPLKATVNQNNTAD